MSRLPAGKASSTLGRVRWFRGSREVQTEQSHPRTGTPVDVPVPRKISRLAAAVGLSINRINLQNTKLGLAGSIFGLPPQPSPFCKLPFYEKKGRSATRAGAASGLELTVCPQGHILHEEGAIHEHDRAIRAYRDSCSTCGRATPRPGDVPRALRADACRHSCGTDQRSCPHAEPCRS